MLSPRWRWGGLCSICCAAAWQGWPQQQESPPVTSVSFCELCPTFWSSHRVAWGGLLNLHPGAEGESGWPLPLSPHACLCRKSSHHSVTGINHCTAGLSFQDKPKLLEHSLLHVSVSPAPKTCLHYKHQSSNIYIYILKKIEVLLANVYNTTFPFLLLRRRSIWHHKNT